MCAPHLSQYVKACREREERERGRELHLEKLTKENDFTKWKRKN